MARGPKTGVGGTVDAFNFIRRVAFPSTPRVVAIFALVGLASATVSLTLVGESVGQILVFAGAVLVWPPALGEVVSSALFLRKDRILDFRRLMGVEIIAIIPTASLLLLFSIVGALSGETMLWADGFLAGLAVSLPVRFLTTMAMSSGSSWKKLSAGLPAPLFTLASFLTLSPFLTTTTTPSILRATILMASGLVLSAVGVLLIIRKVEGEGDAEIHHSPMGLFRSFLDHWLRKTPAALEERLLSLSTEGSIETKILSFSGDGSKPIASLVVSNFHPGPYRDMGSGGLPSELKHSLEKSHRGIVQVPHGVSNHKLNIVSHRDIDRLIAATNENYPASHPIGKASTMIREQEGEAIVSGQAFGNVALLTVTLSPEEMEDLPTEVSVEIEKEASKLGFEVLIIDAHNSLSGQTSITSPQAERIIAAAIRVLGRLKDLSQGPFSVGAAFDPLEGYGLRDGIGPGGLSTAVLRTQGGPVAYITVDGNNMKQGLRDKLLVEISDAGVKDAEVMTTDTHLVTGHVRSPLGYYPVGAAWTSPSFDKLVVESVEKAMKNMEGASAGLSKFSLNMPVLGSEAFQSISGFIGRIARQIGKSFLWLEISSLTVALFVLFVV
jgi:predicted neutral ceramidase superfamily lipid hydrolase